MTFGGAETCRSHRYEYDLCPYLFTDHAQQAGLFAACKSLKPDIGAQALAAGVSPLLKSGLLKQPRQLSRSTIPLGLATLLMCALLATWAQEWTFAQLLRFRTTVSSTLKTPLLPASSSYSFRGKSNEDLAHCILHVFDPHPARTSMTAGQLKFLHARIGHHLLQTPEALRFLATYLIDLRRSGVSWFFVDLRNNENTMIHLATVLHRVDSAPTAIASLRFLQILLLPEPWTTSLCFSRRVLTYWELCTNSNFILSSSDSTGGIL